MSLLTGGGPDVPRRHQALRAALAWSVDLLEPAQHALFRRLGVFVGGWSVEAAEVVATDADQFEEDVLDGLQVLVESSLVHRLDDVSLDSRFGMLETVREYALEQLGQHDEANNQTRRHAAYFLALAEQAEPHLRGEDQRIWFDRLDAELDNLRAALAWAHTTGHPELGLNLAIALAVFYEERGHVREGIESLEALLHELADSSAAPQLSPLRARGLATIGWLAFLQGDYDRAAPLAEQSIALWHQLGEIGNSPVAFNTLAYVALRDGDEERQNALFQQSLELTRAQGDAHGSAAVLSWLGTQQRASGDLNGATALLEESLRLYRTVGTVGGIAYVLLHLGGVARARQDAVRAQALFEESLERYQGLGDRSDAAYATAALASVAADAGDLLRARSLCEESVATFRQLGDIRGMAEELRLLGYIAALQGDDAAAAAAYAECLSLSPALRKVDVAYCLEGLALAVARLGALAPRTNQVNLAVRLLGAAAALREGLGGASSKNWGVAHSESTHANYARQVLAARTAFGETEFDAAWAVGRNLSVEQAIAQALNARPFDG